MIEVLVRQDNVADRSSGEPSDIGVDRGRLGQRAAGVDQQDPGTAQHQPDRDVTEREPTAVHGAGQSFPGEVHKEEGSRNGDSVTLPPGLSFEQGAAVPVNYATGLYDLVLDALGRTSLRRSYGLLRPGGRLVGYGVSALQKGEKRSLRRAAPQALAMVRGFNLLTRLEDSKAVIGLNMLRLWDDRGTLEPWITPLTEALDDGRLPDRARGRAVRRGI